MHDVLCFPVLNRRLVVPVPIICKPIVFYAHPASCKMGTEFFPGVKCSRGVLLTTHPLLVSQSWKSRAIPVPTLWAKPSLNGINLPLPFYSHLWVKNYSCHKIISDLVLSTTNQLTDNRGNMRSLVVITLSSSTSSLRVTFSVCTIPKLFFEMLSSIFPL